MVVSAFSQFFDKEDYMLKLSQKKRKALLALAVAAAVLGANNAFAASVHDKAITESN